MLYIMFKKIKVSTTKKKEKGKEKKPYDNILVCYIS